MLFKKSIIVVGLLAILPSQASQNKVAFLSVQEIENAKIDTLRIVPTNPSKRFIGRRLEDVNDNDRIRVAIVTLQELYRNKWPQDFMAEYNDSHRLFFLHLRDELPKRKPNNQLRWNTLRKKRKEGTAPERRSQRTPKSTQRFAVEIQEGKKMRQLFGETDR